MANPRQRRKAKSATHKKISHTKRAKRLLKKMPAIRGPKALQDAWDPSKTLCQNYLALGLQYDLNPISSGGSEVSPVHTIDQHNADQAHATTLSAPTDEAQSEPSALPKGFGRIVRDSSGHIVHVELPTDAEEHALQSDLVVDTPIIMKEPDLRMWANDYPEVRPGCASRSVQGMVIQDLENLAASAVVQKRYTSVGEKAYLERLVRKHGDNLQKMAHDRRLNPEQRTANELRRAITRAGGYDVLRNGTDVAVAG